MRLYLLLCLLLCSTYCQSRSTYSYKMAFGSCFKHGQDSSILDYITDERPDSFVWGGDFAYLDTAVKKTFKFQRSSFSYSSEAYMREKFETTYNDPRYKRLRQSTKIYGVWDDHDSGINDSDRSNKVKDLVRGMFLDYIDEPKHSVRRTQEDGMYAAYFLDEEKQIKLILLDCRFARTSSQDVSVAEDDRSDLGKTQEAWFVDELSNSTAQYTVIVFGFKVTTLDRAIIELAYARTKRLITETFNSKTNIILVTGDVHFAELGSDECSASIHGYPIIELTSSGLTSTNTAKFEAMTAVIAGLVFPPTYVHPEDRYYDKNYATLDFNISTEEPSKSSLTLRVHNQVGKTVIYKQLDSSYFRKLSKPDLVTFNQCQANRGTPANVLRKHMVDYCLDYTKPMFYFLLSWVLAGLHLLWLLSDFIGWLRGLFRTSDRD